MKSLSVSAVGIRSRVIAPSTLYSTGIVPKSLDSNKVWRKGTHLLAVLTCFQFISNKNELRSIVYWIGWKFFSKTSSAETERY